MIKRFGAAVVVVALMSGASPSSYAAVTFETGNTIFQNCQEPDGAFLKIVCGAYIIGIADALDGNSIDLWTACLPEHVLRGQVIDIAVEWLRAHPEARHFQAAGLVARALSEAYPCR